jgi:hypothetical protein
MTYVRSTFRHPALPKNEPGYTVDYYEGSLSTLCGDAGMIRPTRLCDKIAI